MPHGVLKLVPGVDEVKTAALNEMNVSQSDLIRFMPDRNGLGLVQKLGGWIKFYPNTLPSPIRELHAWEDLNNQKWLAVGAETELGVINNGNLTDITPHYKNNNVAVSVSTTAGSTTVQIVDASSSAFVGTCVNILTPISVGGIILSGVYTITNVVNTSTYQITVPTAATSTVTNGGAVPQFTTSNGSSTVIVTFPNHGYAVNDTAAFLVPTTISGLTIYGQYTVASVTNANTFTINANFQASGSASVYMNGNLANYYYYISPGALSLGYGYGGAGYGRFGYGGTTPIVDGTAITTTDWVISNFGQVMVANPNNGAIYYWIPGVGQSTAQVLSNAPTINFGIFVAMPQRQLVAYGSTFNGIQDPLLIRWTDVENLNDWTATAINQAGSYRIPEGSMIMAAIQGPQQGVIWTDQSVWAMQYVGQPYVYSFNKLGTGIGAISKKCVGMLNNVIYWLSPKSFNVLSNNGPQPVPCAIWDVFYQNLDEANSSKIRCAVNSLYNEITWFYPSLAGGGEVDSYVKYNPELLQWDYGTLGRTAWIDASVLGNPIGAGADKYIYQHEIGYNADTQPMLSSFQTGYMQLNEADNLIFLDQIWPDMKWGPYGQSQNATVQITFYGTNYPGDTPIQYGPYEVTQATEYLSVRIRHRLLSIKVSSNDYNTFWRLGAIRYRFMPDGRF